MHILYLLLFYFNYYLLLANAVENQAMTQRYFLTLNSNVYTCRMRIERYIPRQQLCRTVSIFAKDFCNF